MLTIFVFTLPDNILVIPPCQKQIKKTGVQGLFTLYIVSYNLMCLSAADVPQSNTFYSAVTYVRRVGTCLP